MGNLVSAKEKLNRFYSVFKSDDQVLIMVTADPDAIASAMAVKRLLWRKVAGVAISSTNIIKRPDNLAMVELLGVTILKPADVKKGDYNRFVIVDSQPHHNELFRKFDYDVIIDHHPKGDGDASFVDIRPDYGATASIMTEYVKAAKIRPSMKLATGLFLGIKTDTKNFERHALAEDIKAFRFLFKYVNLHLAQRIEGSEIQPGFLKYYERALEGRRLRRGRMFVHLGTVMSPDVCVLIADFFMQVNGVKWSIVSGIYGKKLIVIFRNDGLRKNAGNLAEKSFGMFGSAGGHRSMARAELPVASLNGEVDFENTAKMQRWVIGRIEKKS